jgi:hypothetical protein
MSNGTGVLSPEVKCSHGMTLTTEPRLVPRLWMSRSYTSSSPCTSMGVLWDCFTFTESPSFIFIVHSNISSSFTHGTGLIHTWPTVMRTAITSPQRHSFILHSSLHPLPFSSFSHFIALKIKVNVRYSSVLTPVIITPRLTSSQFCISKQTHYGCAPSSCTTESFFQTARPRKMAGTK